MKTNLIYYGDPRLSETCRPMEKSEVDRTFYKVIENMRKKMKRKNGIGLSASQIGDMRRFFVFMKKVAINPEIIEESIETSVMEEGCLSTPNINVLVERPIEIKVSYRDLSWNEVTETLRGLDARVFMHELDHLNGIMFLDRTTQEERDRVKESLEQVVKIYGSQND